MLVYVDIQTRVVFRLKCGPSDTYPLFFVDVILPNTCNIYDIIVCSLNSMSSGYFSVNIFMKTYIFLFFSNKNYIIH